MPSTKRNEEDDTMECDLLQTLMEGDRRRKKLQHRRKLQYGNIKNFWVNIEKWCAGSNCLFPPPLSLVFFFIKWWAKCRRLDQIHNLADICLISIGSLVLAIKTSHFFLVLFHSSLYFFYQIHPLNPYLTRLMFVSF